MCYKTNELKITGMSIRAEMCQILGVDSQNPLTRKTSSIKDIWRLGRETCKKINQLLDRSCVSRNNDEKWKVSGLESRKPGMDKRETKVWQCPKTRKLTRPVTPAIRCEKSPKDITKVCAKLEMTSEKNTKTLYGCIMTSQSWRPHYR